MPAATEETVDAPAVDRALDETAPSGGVSGTGPTRSVIDPAPGTVIGRYVVLSPLGAGAMGVVVAAFDPELDRKVAIKLLKSRPGSSGEAARARLLREAQALARLNHSHVVGVHDVGIHAGQVFIAMEFVAGSTLGDWMTSTPGGGPRPWREVIPLFAAAGQGLAAAHHGGLIHRDFKPENVMLGDDGRIRVMDFGLARSDDADSPASASPIASATSTSAESPLATPLTRTGAIMGTPAYMSPEQFAGLEVTARSDQFGFCVALFEALYGARPFVGSTLAQLALAVSEGQITIPPSAAGGAIPKWLDRLVRRGLSPEPEDRFPDMSALLVALDTGEARRRRGRRLALVGAASMIGLGAFGLEQLDVSRRTAACEGHGDAIRELWNERTAATIRAAMIDTGVRYAEATEKRITPWLNRHADAWAQERTEACMRADVHESWSEDTATKATWCLEDQRLAFAATLGELERADAGVVERAVRISSGLASPEACMADSVLSGMPSPPDDANAVNAVRRALSLAGAVSAAGKYDAALEATRAALADARTVGWAPLVARAQTLEASIVGRTGGHQDAERVGADAYLTAARARAWDVAAEAAVGLIYTVGVDAARHAEGEIWANHAEVAIHHAGDPLGVRESWRVGNLAIVLERRGEYDEAKKLHQRALELKVAAVGADHPSLSAPWMGLGNIHYRQGKLEEARDAFTQALEIKTATLPAAHPDLASSTGNLAIVHLKLGQHDEAKALMNRALEINEAAFGPDHIGVAASLNNLAGLHSALDDPETALVHFERALSIRERALGPDHPDLASSLGGIGNSLAGAGRLAEAVAPLQRALAIREASLGPEHPKLAHSLGVLGKVFVELGRHGPAIETLERGLAIVDLQPGVPDIAGEIRVALATALWDADVDRGRARELVVQARDAYRAAGAPFADNAAKAEAWLGAHL